MVHENGGASPWPLIDGVSANGHAVIMMWRARHGVVHGEHVCEWSATPSSHGDVFEESVNRGGLDDVVVGVFIGCSFCGGKEIK